MTTDPSAPGSDFLQLAPAGVPRRGLTDWLVAELRAAITDGRLVSGDRLPPTRTLAADLGVSRGVVVETYRRLGEEALLDARPKIGTVVVGPSEPPPRKASTPPPHGLPLHPTGIAALPAVSLPTLPDDLRADGIDLSPGVPDLSTFPRAAWLRAERTVLDGLALRSLRYGDPRGDAEVRTVLAAWLARTRGVRADAEDVIVVDGVAQSLALLAHVLTAAGQTTVAVEDPGSRGACEELAYWGLQPVPVPVDEHGLRVELLSDLPGDSVTATVLLTPAHQFPTGVVLAPQRRRALVQWAAPDRLLVEDDYDAEYRYDRAPVAALQASAPHLVAYTGSTSKTLAPALRIGWLVPPPGLRAALVDAKHASDLGSPILPQLVLGHLVATGQYERHIRRVRARHRARRDALLAALTAYVPTARVHGVAAGLHLMVTFPGLGREVDDQRLAADLRATGVVTHPLSWHRMSTGPPGLVLGYAATAPDRLHEAARLLAGALPAPAGRRPFA